MPVAERYRSSLIDTSEHRKKLERRLQAQLNDGSRSKYVKRLGDPLVKHLLRVAANESYRLAPQKYSGTFAVLAQGSHSGTLTRAIATECTATAADSRARMCSVLRRNLRQSVIVTGKTLICELLSGFPCRRLALRRQGLEALRSALPRLRSSTDPANPTDTVVPPAQFKSLFVAGGGASFDVSRKLSPPLSVNIETHYVSNRILRKVAGFHSYNDGCIAEMRMPDPAENFGNIRLLLCLGHLPPVLGRTNTSATLTLPGSAHDSLDSGAIGTLLRTATALQWQGAWILPSCPDIFNPLAIRASQGALFRLPYRRGGVEELVQLCREKDLAICIPHENGIPMNTAGIFEERQKKGVCLVIDSSFMRAAASCSATSRQQHEHTRGISGVSSYKHERASPKKRSARSCTFKPHICLSLGTDVAPKGSMKLLHSITVASLMIYHIKQAHFPGLQGSPHIFP